MTCVEDSEEIRLQRLPKIIAACLFDGLAEVTNAGVIDEDIDASGGSWQ